MSQDQDEDKQFEPSQKKLDDARKKGEIAKSNDLTTAAAYGGMLLVFAAFGSSSMIGTGTGLMVLLDQPDRLAHVIFGGALSPLPGGILQMLSWNLAPWFALPFGFAMLSIFAQRALVFAPSKLSPKLNRISPISGAKNKFGRQGFFEFGKSFVKLIIYCLILGFFLAGQMNRIVGSMALSPAMIAAELGRMAIGLLGLVLIVATVLGAVDYLWQHAEHLRKNRMSRKEMQDEIKQSEGDPKLKQQRRQKGLEIATSQIRVEVPKADVIVVNPTHYAVALKWDKTSLSAPICLAKGVDAMAATIREVAMEHAIPIHSDPPTARALYATVDVGSEIAPDHYAAVAVAIRFAESIRSKARAK